MASVLIDFAAAEIRRAARAPRQAGDERVLVQRVMFFVELGAPR